MALHFGQPTARRLLWSLQMTSTHTLHMPQMHSVHAKLSRRVDSLWHPAQYISTGPWWWMPPPAAPMNEGDESDSPCDEMWKLAPDLLLSTEDSTDGKGTKSLFSGWGGVMARWSGEAAYVWLWLWNCGGLRSGGREARFPSFGDPGTWWLVRIYEYDYMRLLACWTICGSPCHAKKCVPIQNVPESGLDCLLLLH
jgi:hypothetical protein